MKFTFAIALLAAVTVAKNSKKSTGQEDFIDYAVKQGKNYQSVEEFVKREANFKKSKAKVDEMNEKCEKMGKGSKLAKFANNFTSDLDDDEFKAMMGLSELPDRRLLNDVVPEEDGRRNLAANVDWVAQGVMAPMKNQGQCGSCWSFAAATALEGMQAIKYGTTPVRLSEQSAVDCTARTCATGGWMNDAWNFWQSQGGAPSNANYEYTGTDKACETDKLNAPVTQVASFGWADSDPTNKIQAGPLTVALEAGSDCFRYYETGILSANEAASLGCGNAWDHAVVAVAFTNATSGGDGSCTTETECTYPDSACEWVDIHCRPGECYDQSTCVTVEGQCGDNEENCEDWMEYVGSRKATTAEKAIETCADGMPTMPNRRGRPNKRCYIYEWTATRCSVEQECAPEECDTIYQCDEAQQICNDVETCTEAGDASPAFWTIQNSWSQWWGDNGFIKIAHQGDGMGVLGMEYYLQQVYAA